MEPTLTLPPPRISLVVVLGARILYILTRVGLPPVVLAHVGLAEYGLWAACFILVAWTGLGPTGVGLLLVRGVADAAAQRNLQLIGRRMAESMVLTAFLSAIVLGIVVLATPSLLSALKVDPSLAATARGVFIGTCAIVLVDACMSVPGLALQGLRRTSDEQLSWVTGFLVETVAIISLLTAGFGLMGMLAAFGLRTATTAALSTWRLRRLLPGLRFELSAGWLPRCRSMLRQGLVLQASQVSAIALTSIDRVIAGTTLGPTGTGLMDLGGKFSTTMGAFAAAVCGNITSQAAHHHATDDKAGLAAAAITGLRQITALMALAMPALVFLAGPLLAGWLGAREELAQVGPIMVAAALGANLLQLTGPVNAVLRTASRLRYEVGFHILRLACVAGGVGSVLALYGASATSIAAGMAIGSITATLAYLPFAYGKLGVPLGKWLRVTILPYCMGYATAAFAGWIIALAWGVPFFSVEPWARFGRQGDILALLAGGAIHAGLQAIFVWNWVLDDTQRRGILARLPFPLPAKFGYSRER
ncbi:MAG: hypothetical protein RLZZ200_2559 [Pseudomonadota bacterium]|jgi:O-antigen/teichoic acid export membrane protein